MIMPKKKAVLGIIISLFIALLVAMYLLGGFLPVFGRLIAKTKLNSYKDGIAEVRYDFINNYYLGSDSNGNQYKYYLGKNTIYDPVYDDLMRETIDKQYQSFLESCPFDSVVFPSEGDAYTTLDAKDHSKSYVKLYLISVYDAVHLNEEDTKLRMCEILEELCRHIDCNITAIQYRYNNLDGMYEMDCDFDDKPIMSRDLKAYIEKSEHDEQDIIYIQWKKEHKEKSSK